MDITGDQHPDPHSPTVCTPVRSEAFQKAIQEYIDNLSDDDRAAFQSATDVMEKLQDLDQRKTLISSSHTKKAQQVLQCMKQFLGSVSICIQHSPEISSLVVGGLNCILTVPIPLIPSNPINTNVSL